MATWALISCSKLKADHPCSVKEMYWPSALFRGAWRVAKMKGQKALILSAKYGVLLPEQIIDPYDKTLYRMTKQERAEWRTAVLDVLFKLLNPSDKVISYLPRLYAEGIIEALKGKGYEVEEPIAGLGRGQRLKWFKDRLQEETA